MQLVGGIVGAGERQPSGAPVLTAAFEESVLTVVLTVEGPEATLGFDGARRGPRARYLIFIIMI